MNIEYLREFIVMAQESNYTEAADKLFLSQSTLFKHVKSLESELGVTLFKKYGRSTVITNYGEILLKYAQQIVKLNEECMGEISKAQENRGKQITVAYQYRVIDLIRDFCLENRGYNVLLSQKNKNAINQLLDREADVAILLTGIEDENQKALLERTDVIPLTNDSFILAVPVNHRLAKKSAVRLSDLEGETLIQPSGIDDPMISYLRDRGVSVSIAMNAVTGTEAADMVSSGLGVSILHRMTIEEIYSEDELCIREFDPPIETQIAIATRKDERPEKAIRLFIDFARRYYEPPKKNVDTQA
ncbi:MAG: LysR family transcriptional regulator [Lachnospiraceae bacterium]|nr:LysR family transcriptional regulator [Lachnospiraceae bacterium]